ncbi:MAG TPA: YkgJ family cysteine cluster protein [Pseudomonas sp.]|nr:YkgJ family cysteine cluster protein [Pseudomonas sp.]
MTQHLLLVGADPDRLETWIKFPGNTLCHECRATCCSLPVEVRVKDLIRLGVVDEFEAGEPPKQIAKRLMKDGIVGRFNQKSGIFTLEQHSSGDCLYLDQKTRLCTVYANRPDTCRNHPKIGPKPGYCAFRPKTLRR